QLAVVLDHQDAHRVAPAPSTGPKVFRAWLRVEQERPHCQAGVIARLRLSANARQLTGLVYTGGHEDTDIEAQCSSSASPPSTCAAAPARACSFSRTTCRPIRRPATAF